MHNNTVRLSAARRSTTQMFSVFNSIITHGVAESQRLFRLGDIIGKKAADLENVGFMFQQMDLYQQTLGLDVCWLGMGRMNSQDHNRGGGYEVRHHAGFRLSQGRPTAP